ncbi:MAG TPA: hypothetical protein VGF08_06685, partial [Terriglobales bacterium]
MLSRRSKIWISFLLALVLGQAFSSLILPHSFGLTTVSDLTQCAVLFSGVAALGLNSAATQGRLRIFWALLALALALWLAYQITWTYFEVHLRRDVPEIFSGDIVLFLHIVPMMAALALRPHRQQDERASKFGTLDFAILLIGWVYLFLYSVIPWQYAAPNEFHYSHNLNAIYMTEKVVFLGGVALAWSRSSRGWRTIYGQVFIASASYAVTSYLANWAIETRRYYTGSLYDVPLIIAMAWFTIVALLARDASPKVEDARRGRDHGVWLARLGMITIFSLPLFALWAVFNSAQPPAVRTFRVVLTFAIMVIMGAMVF